MLKMVDDFVRETVASKPPECVKVPLLPDDGIPTTMEIVRACNLIHQAYMKNCAATHREEQRATIQRLHRRSLKELRGLDL